MSDDKLKQKADQPKSVDIDGQKVEQHSLNEQIALDRYLAAKEAARRGLGIKITKMAAGGSVC